MLNIFCPLCFTKKNGLSSFDTKLIESFHMIGTHPISLFLFLISMNTHCRPPGKIQFGKKNLFFLCLPLVTGLALPHPSLLISWVSWSHFLLVSVNTSNLTPWLVIISPSSLRVVGRRGNSTRIPLSGISLGCLFRCLRYRTNTLFVKFDDLEGIGFACAVLGGIFLCYRVNWVRRNLFQKFAVTFPISTPRIKIHIFLW